MGPGEILFCGQGNLCCFGKQGQMVSSVNRGEGGGKHNQTHVSTRSETRGLREIRVVGVDDVVVGMCCINVLGASDNITFRTFTKTKTFCITTSWKRKERWSSR